MTSLDFCKQNCGRKGKKDPLFRHTRLRGRRNRNVNKSAEPKPGPVARTGAKANRRGGGEGSDKRAGNRDDHMASSQRGER